MKKYLYSALALPLLFACSSDDLIEKQVVSNDPFPGVEKVNATFYMDEDRASTRMDKTGWDIEKDDLFGFAWMTDKYEAMQGDAKVPVTGSAFQNHNLIVTNGRFEPQTSIYVGKYYFYRPYDDKTTSPQAINFNSLKVQPMKEGYPSGTGTSEYTAWKQLAKTAIIIADKWTDINPDGRAYAGSTETWDQPGIKKPYKVFPSFFSNQTGLDLTYLNNNPTFEEAKNITGATDINYNIIGSDPDAAADIYSATIKLTGAANAFTYAPMAEPNNGAHNGEFWAAKTAADVAGFTWAADPAAAPAEPVAQVPFDVITLKAPENNPISTVIDGQNKGWFWFNSLPVTAEGGATVGTKIVATIATTYGTVTINKNGENDLTVGDCAYAFVDPTTAEHPNNLGNLKDNGTWIKLGNVTNVTAAANPKTWAVAHSFVNKFGNRKGKYVLTADLATAVMDIHIMDDTHLQKYLKFYMASNKQDAVTLVLDGDADKEFKLSKLSIAMLQTINSGRDADHKVLVRACNEQADATHNVPEGGKVKIIVTQKGQTGDLAGKTEVPALNNVFAEPTRVYLAKNTNWTWTEGEAADGKIPGGKLTIDDGVTSVRNLGTITVNATNLQLSIANKAIYNEAGATMNITKVTTAKSPLINFGEINVGSATNTAAELRAYGNYITNDATSLTAYGIINNYGAVGVSEGTGAAAKFNNYGHINMFGDAITLLTTNELDATPADENGPFKTAFNAATNKMGTVVLPEGKPAAIVSVSNEAETGFIKYNWDATTYSKATTNVKYNTIVIDNHNIEFTGDAPATEVQFIEFKNTNRALVVNPAAADKLTSLRGIIVNAGSSIIIEKTNKVECKDGAFLGEGATVYKGGAFTYPAGGTTNYLGNWTADQVVVFGN